MHVRCRYMNSRATAHQAYVPTDIEHFANVVTHGVSVTVLPLCLKIFISTNVVSFWTWRSMHVLVW